MLDLPTIIVTILVLALQWKRCVDYWKGTATFWKQRCSREQQKVEHLRMKVERLENAKPKFSNGKAFKVVGTVNGTMLMDAADMEAEYERLFEQSVLSEKIIKRLRQVKKELSEKLSRQTVEMVTVQLAYEKLLQEKYREQTENESDKDEVDMEAFDDIGLPEMMGDRMDYDVGVSDEMDEVMRALG